MNSEEATEHRPDGDGHFGPNKFLHRNVFIGSVFALFVYGLASQYAMDIGVLSDGGFGFGAGVLFSAIMMAIYATVPRQRNGGFSDD